MAEHIPDGGPAFPIPGGSWEACGGMSLRDHFAGHALAGILAAPNKMGEEASNHADKAAEWSYQYADAMIAAREKRV